MVYTVLQIYQNLLWKWNFDNPKGPGGGGGVGGGEGEEGDSTESPEPSLNPPLLQNSSYSVRILHAVLTLDIGTP